MTNAGTTRHRFFLPVALAAVGLLVVGGAAAAAEEVEIGSAYGTDTTPVSVLLSDEAVAGLSGQAGSAYYFQIYVAPGTRQLSLMTAGGQGDCDLYLAHGYLPEPAQYEYVARLAGTHEKLVLRNPRAGTWYLLVYGQGDFADVTVAGSWREAHLASAYMTYYTTYVPNRFYTVRWYDPHRFHVARRIALLRRPRLSLGVWWRSRRGLGISFGLGGRSACRRPTVLHHPPRRPKPVVVAAPRVARPRVLARPPAPRVAAPRSRSAPRPPARSRTVKPAPSRTARPPAPRVVTPQSRSVPRPPARSRTVKPAPSRTARPALPAKAATRTVRRPTQPKATPRTPRTTVTRPALRRGEVRSAAGSSARGAHRR